MANPNPSPCFVTNVSSWGVYECVRRCTWKCVYERDSFYHMYIILLSPPPHTHPRVHTFSPCGGGSCLTNKVRGSGLVVRTRMACSCVTLVASISFTCVFMCVCIWNQNIYTEGLKSMRMRGTCSSPLTLRMRSPGLSLPTLAATPSGVTWTWQHNIGDKHSAC